MVWVSNFDFFFQIAVTRVIVDKWLLNKLLLLCFVVVQYFVVYFLNCVYAILLADKPEWVGFILEFLVAMFQTLHSLSRVNVFSVCVSSTYILCV